MTRTTNYQLPRWEANDPVRREDFNQAMANIEAGLTNDQAAAAKSIGQLWDGLMYGAERDLLAFRSQADAGRTPADPHIVYNGLDTASDAQSLSGAAWNEEKHIYLGAETCITLDDIKANSGVSQMGYVRSAAQDYSAYYYFTSPGKVHVTGWSFMLMTFFSSSTAGQMDLQFELRAEKKEETGWSVAFQSESFPVHTEGTGTVTIWPQAPADFITERDTEYRVALRLASGGETSGAFGFTSSDSTSSLYTNDIRVSFTPVAETEGRHVKQLPTAGMHRALVLARYNVEPSEGGVSAFLNETALDCAYRDGTDRNGQACRELRALARGPFPETSALRLDLSCGDTDDFCLLDYSVCLL